MKLFCDSLILQMLFFITWISNCRMDLTNVSAKILPKHCQHGSLQLSQLFLWITARRHFGKVYIKTLTGSKYPKMIKWNSDTVFASSRPRAQHSCWQAAPRHWAARQMRIQFYIALSRCCTLTGNRYKLLIAFVFKTEQHVFWILWSCKY